MKLIIKFFPEIMLKGNAAKKKMVGHLNTNIRILLLRINPEIEIKSFRDKIEVVCEDSDGDRAIDVLCKTPGIEQILKAEQFHAETLDEISEIVSRTAIAKVENKTFVVRVKRRGTHDFSSFEMERTIGAYIFERANHKGVNLHKPDVKIEMEYDHHHLNVIDRRYRGLGGFPLGSQGELLSLMSGGFDSTIASYLTIKRGIKTHFIFFNLGGDAHEIGVKQVALYLWGQYSSTHDIQFITVPFDDVVTELFNSVHESYMGVMLKRLMLQASEKVADTMGIDALVTGESIAQVSSQTLRNLAIIDEATNKLVLRPLATMHKPEIIAIAQAIGTKDFAENMPEYCGVISKNPVINGSFKRIEKEAAKFNMEILNQAVDKSISISVGQIVDDVNKKSAVDVVQEIISETVIDIRKPEEVERSPLVLSTECLVIPFFELKQKFKKLEQDKSYLFYCEKGVMSQLHAQYLIDEGFDNVKVYRP